MGFRFPVAAKSYAALVRASSPVTGQAPESIPYVFYDSQTYVDNTSTRLTFFVTTNNDRSLSNMDTAGQLPHPTFFELFYAGLDVLRAPTTAAGGVAGAIDDVQRLILTSRPRATFMISDKKYLEIPLSFLHASGGATGFGWGTFTAEESIQYANNGMPDGGWCFDGAIIIPSKVQFSWVFEWPAAVDLTADVVLRLWMAGTYHRRVQ